MKFKDYKYVRPDFNAVAGRLEALAKKIEASLVLEEIEACIDELFKIQNEYETMTTLAMIRSTIDTNDEFYSKELEVIQEESNIVTSKETLLYKALVEHKLRSELEKKYGSYWFKSMEISLKCYDDSVSDLLVAESKLTTEYDRVMASAQIEFNGIINNLSQMKVYTSSTDRNIRFSAMKKINEFLSSKEEQIDDIYDKLVHIRTDIAHKLGFKNFIELGYLRMGRTDYDDKDVSKYRKQVVDYLVPVANKIIKENALNIGIENPKFYDLGLQFLDGNPTPKGNKDELVQKALNMYSEMSKETKEFFTFMVEHELLDLETKKGKQNGGYCTYINGYNSPFIFSNFNGTSADVDVLTHEAGHAFMAYLASKDIKNPSLIWPTSEACEIHSMSMEFLAYPWMDDFFKEDTRKYKISHTNDALTFIPYGCCVDHFQHLVYENPDATKNERKEMWKKCEKLYTPWRDMEGLEMYEKGNFWYNQLHIFQTPFYYIDYTLAQVCALEFYVESLEDREKTWDRYVKLCKLGGSKSFLELLDSVGLHNPFKDGGIEFIVKRIIEVKKTY